MAKVNNRPRLDPPAQKASQDQTFSVGGKNYTVRFSIKAMAALQDHFGLKSIVEVGKKLSKLGDIDMYDFVAMMWAGLRRHHPDLTKDEVMNIMDDVGLQSCQEVVFSAFGASLPLVNAAKENQKEKAPPKKP